MTPGRFARRMLGDRFQIAGEVYRRIFVDMRRPDILVTMTGIAPEIGGFIARKTAPG